MCLPKPPAPSINPSPVPSMQAADNIQFGSPGRGAAMLGRLALRLGGPSSGVASGGAQGTGPGTQAPTGPSTAQAGAANPLGNYTTDFLKFNQQAA